MAVRLAKTAMMPIATDSITVASAATHALACDPARHCGHSSDNHAFGTLHEPDLALDAKALGTCPHIAYHK